MSSYVCTKCGYCGPTGPEHQGCNYHGALVHSEEEYRALELQNQALQKQLLTAQDVINQHCSDAIEGLHCVQCLAEPDQLCDCPMLVPFWEAMKGYHLKRCDTRDEIIKGKPCNCPASR